MGQKMAVFQGIGASRGYAVGTAYLWSEEEATGKFREQSQDPAGEEKRLRAAVKSSEQEIRALADSSRSKLGDKNTAILESHLDFLKDPAFTGEALRQIRQNSYTAEKAVSGVTETLYHTFQNFDDEVMKERAEDIRDIGSRLLRNLAGKKQGADLGSLKPGTILFAHQLKPSDTAQINPDLISAFVTEIGGKTSHTAILASGLGIAAVVGCRSILSFVHSGDPVIVDGNSGKVILNPDEATLKDYQSKISLKKKQNEEFGGTKAREIRDSSGKRILVTANIGGIRDLKAALQNGADGVGLFRTEFLFMGREEMPSEEEQFQVYCQAAELLEKKPLTIRTLDIGGDKNLPYLNMPPEDNPFLGVRAIRLCLKNQELFKAQLRAILRAATRGNIQIMFPMIGSERELKQAKAVLESCKADLRNRNAAYGSVKVGIMVEIPSAALTAETLAPQADFFSIGTNDLTQYTLAADRMNEGVAEYYNSMHPAVLRLIRMTIEAAHKASIPCYMCGELAAEESAAQILLQYGLDEFSVSPGLIRSTKDLLLKKIH